MNPNPIEYGATWREGDVNEAMSALIAMIKPMRYSEKLGLKVHTALAPRLCPARIDGVQYHSFYVAYHNPDSLPSYAESGAGRG